MKKAADRALTALIVFSHESLGLSPNQLSGLGLALGLLAAGLTATGHIAAGIVVLAMSQIADGLDGGVARRYGLQSEQGRLIEAVADRTCEIAFFLALAAAGLATPKIALLACAAVLLVTLGERASGFDPGFKRFMMYFGYALEAWAGVPGFEIALNVVFFANLAGFAAGTIIADYRIQRKVDAEAIVRRDFEIASGIARRPDDPPSFLSKLFS
ncbi:MAG TPA: CDP-alcohol phosphatidyltransferase family protein [Bacteroidota bacterium]|nr:CDP-alcohol phosphatidyltransferase family protein [Bacteroidota bacterium]